MKNNNDLKANATKLIGRLRMLTVSMILLLSSTSAWAVTEKEILAADPRIMLKGIMQACEKDNENKFFTYYSSNLIYMFSKKSKSDKTKLFVTYCKEFQDLLRPYGPIDKIKISVIKTKAMQDKRPIFAMCLSHPSIKKTCEGRGELDVYLENGQVKMDEH
jgi:hypothetical protein